VKPVRSASGESGLIRWLAGAWPDLDVLPFAHVHITPHMQEQIIQLTRGADQRLAMIGERQRNKPSTGQPTIDSA
jgi:hypothetical protein